MTRDPKEVPYLQAFVGWTTLVAVLFSAILLGANRPVSWSLMAMGMLPLFALQVLGDVVRGLPRNIGWVLVPAGLYLGVLAWAIVQTQPVSLSNLAHPSWSLAPDGIPKISADPIAGIHYIMRLATYGMIFWIMLRSFGKVDRSVWMLAVIAIWSTLLAIYGLGALAVGENPVLGEEAGKVVSATFVNRNSYATYAVFGVMANLAMYMHLQNSGSYEADQRRQVLRDFLERFFTGSWIFALGVLVCLGALFATQSRAGSIAGVLALATFLLSQRNRFNGTSKYALITIAVVIGLVLIALTSSVMSRLMATSEESLRFIIYPRIAEVAMERPVLGHGLGSFQNVFRAHVPLEAASAEWRQAHNSYLENIFELGVPAAIAFYGALLLLGLIILRGVLVRRSHRGFPIFALACFVAAAFHALFDFSLQMPAVASLFATILAMGVANSWRRSPERSRTRKRKQPREKKPDAAPEPSPDEAGDEPKRSKSLAV